MFGRQLFSLILRVLWQEDPPIWNF